MKYSLNLASRSYVNRRAIYLTYVVCAAILTAGLIFNGGYMLKLDSQVTATRKRLAELEEKLLASQGETVEGYNAERFEKILSDIDTANEILKRDSFRWTLLLDRLEQTVPANVSIQKIEPDHKTRSIEIDGFAKNLGDMKTFLDRLIASGDYGDVLLHSQSLDEKKGSVPLVRFKVELTGAF